MTQSTMPPLSVVIPRKPQPFFDYADYRRESLTGINEVRETSGERSLLPPFAFLMVWAFLVRIAYQMAVMDGMDLTILGLS